MWTNEKKGERKAFEPHPAGTFAAVCCDVFEMEVPNNYYNTVNKFTGEMDTRRTITKACVAFLTTEQVEIDGVLKPRYTSLWATKNWNEKGNLRKFVGGWIPSAAASDVFDPETLIGKTALVSVKQYPRKDGSMGHTVQLAMALPPGMSAPSIPADFVRHKDKAAKDAASAPVKTPERVVVVNAGDDDLPF